MHYQTTDKRFFLSADDGVVTIREGQEIQECILSDEELRALKDMLDSAFKHHTEFVATGD